MLLVQEDGGGDGSSLLPLLMIVLLFGVMYLLLIRPQQKRRREAAQMQAKLAVGDEVVTIGGLYGTVAEIDDDGETVILETSEDVYSRYARAAITRVNSPKEHASDHDSDHDSDSDSDSDHDVHQNAVVDRREDKD